MPTSMETATKLVEGITELIQASPQEKSQIIGDSLDLLIGEERTALVKHGPGMDASMTEATSDFVIGQLKKFFYKKLAPDASIPEEPPVEPTPEETAPPVE